MADELIYPERQAPAQDELIYPERDELIYPEREKSLLQSGEPLQPGEVPPQQSAALKVAGGVTGLVEGAGRVLSEAGKGIAEGFAPDVPIGPEEAEVQRIQGLGPLTTSVQDIARGAGRVGDVAGRVVSGGLLGIGKGAAQIAREAGAGETGAGQIERDVGTYIVGRGGEGPSIPTPGMPTSIKGLMRTYEGPKFDPNLVRRPQPIERGLRGPEEPIAPEPVQPVAPKQPTKQFENAATEGFDFSSVDFAPEAPVGGRTLEQIAEQDAPAVIGGPYKPPAPGTVMPPKADILTPKAQADITAATTRLVEAERAENARLAAITPEQKAAKTQELRTKNLRRQLEELKAKRAGASEAEKFELARMEQEAQQKLDATIKAKKPTLTVIKGGVENRPQAPDPNSTPHLPPDDPLGPPHIGLGDHAELETSPYAPLTTSITAPASKASIPDTKPQTAVVFKGDIQNLGAIKTLKFGTPAEVEQSLLQYGERVTSLLTVRRSDLPPDAVTAGFDDLPTGKQEATRVIGGTLEGRTHLRAGIDQLKIARIAASSGLHIAAQDARTKGEAHYVEFIKSGGRVEPAPGMPFQVLDPVKHKDLFTEVPTKAAPPTSRSVVVRATAPLLEKDGLYLFGMQPFVKISKKNATLTAVDLAKLSDKGEATALPWGGKLALVGDPMAATVADLQNAGVYWQGKEPSDLDWEDAQRLIWKSSPFLYGEHFPGWMPEFTNLIKRGMRIKVTPQTREFIIRKGAFERAAIPGVNLPNIESDPVPIGYAQSYPFRKDKLTVTSGNPHAIQLTNREKVELRGLGRMAKVILRKLGIKIDLSITPLEAHVMARQGLGYTKKTYGAMQILEGGRFRMLLNMDTMRTPKGAGVVFDKYGNVDLEAMTPKLDPLRLYATFAHEVGHVILEYVWPSLPYAIKEQIMVAAERHALGTRTASYQEAIARGGSLTEYVEEVGLPTTPMQPSFAPYFSSLHEYVARSVERLMFDAVHWSDGAGRFLGALSRQYHTVWNTLKNHDPNFFTPAEAIRDMIDYTARQGVPGNRLGETTEASLQESMRPSGDLALPGIEHPRTGATQGPREALNTLFSRGGGKPPDEAIGAAGGADWLSWQFRQTLSIIELARANSTWMPDGLRYVGVLRAMDVWKTKEVAAREARIKEWNALGRERGDKLTKFLYYMTKQEYRTGQEKRDDTRRHPTQQELINAIRRHGIDAETFQTYENIRQDFKRLSMEFEAWELQQAREKSLKTKITPEELQKKLEKIAGDYAQMRLGPYFPMTRFGTFAYRITDKSTGDLVAYHLYESEQSRRAAEVGLNKQYPSSRFDKKRDLIDKKLQPYIGMPPAMMERIRERLNLAKYPDLEAQFEGLIMESGGPQRFRKRWLKGEGVAGYSQDGIRVYAEYMMHAINNLASRKFGSAAQQHVNAMTATAKDFRDNTRAIKLAAFFQNHLNSVLNPAQDYIKTRAVFFHMYLAYNPKSAIIQLAQLPMSAWPYLTKVYGTGRGTYQLARAFGKSAVNIRKLITDAKFNEPEIKAKARARAIEDNVISGGLVADLAAVASGSLSSYGKNAGTRSLMNWIRWGGWLMSTAEKFGRHTVWDAHWELARGGTNPEHVKEIVESPEYQDMRNEMRIDQELGLTDEQIDTAISSEDAVRRTFYEFGQWTRPPLMQGGKGLLFVFQTQMWQFIKNLFTQKGLVRSWMMALLFGGLVGGIPGSEDLVNLIKQFAGRFFGKDYDLEKDLRKHLIDVWNLDAREIEMVIHGISTESMGISYLLNKMGLPFPRTDTSGSLTLGRVLPGASNLNLRGGFSMEEFAGRAGLNMAGIPGAVLSSIIKFVMDPNVGLNDPKKFEPILPSYVRQPLKALRMAFNGEETNRIGDSILKWDLNDAQDLMDLGVMGMAGFNPTKLTVEQRSIHATLDALNFYKAQSAQLGRQLRAAWENGDPIEIQTRTDAIMAYNEMVAQGGHPEMAINIANQVTAFKTGQKNKMLREQGLTPEKKYRGLSLEMRRLWGSQVIDRKETR